MHPLNANGVIDDRHLGNDLKVCRRAGRRSGAFEYMQRERRGFEHGLRVHLDGAPNAGTIIERNSARSDAHVKERTMIRFLFAWVPGAL